MSPETRQILTIVVILQGLILVALLSTRKKNRKANFFLTAYLVVLLVLISWKTYRGAALFSAIPLSFQFPYTLWFILHPLSYFYVRTLINGTSLKSKDILHLVPWILSVIAMWPYISLDTASKIALWEKQGMSINATFDFVFVLCIVCQGLAYAIAAAALLISHDRRILNLFSNIESIDLRWLRVLVYYLILLHLLSLFAEFLIYYQVEQLYVLYDVSFYAFVLLIYLISYRALAQPQTFYLSGAAGNHSVSDFETPEENEKYRKSRLTGEQSEVFLNRIETYMRDEEPFTDSNLSINDVAETLDIPRHHISQILNVRLNKNFYNYVNEFRVEKTKQLIADPSFQKYSLLGIAMESGFNSKTSFNRIFKSIAGMTPSEYQKEVQG